MTKQTKCPTKIPNVASRLLQRLARHNKRVTLKKKKKKKKNKNSDWLNQRQGYQLMLLPPLMRCSTDAATPTLAFQAAVFTEFEMKRKMAAVCTVIYFVVHGGV